MTLHKRALWLKRTESIDGIVYKASAAVKVYNIYADMQEEEDWSVEGGIVIVFYQR